MHSVPVKRVVGVVAGVLRTDHLPPAYFSGEAGDAVGKSTSEDLSERGRLRAITQ